MIRRNCLIVLLCILFAPAFSFAQADNNANGGGNNGGGNTNAQGGNGGGNNGGGNNGGGNNGGGNGGPGGGGGRNYDPAQRRQQMMDMMKDRLNANDDEWKVIEPKLEKVMDIQRQTRMAGMMAMGRMFGGGRGNRGDRGDRNGGGGGAAGGQGGPGGPPSDNAVSQAMQDLNDTLDKKDATADEINQKLTAFRDARDKSRKDLVDAQKDLQGVLEPRQEAVLVTFGLLD
jgi:hypothetical protein